MRKPQNQAEHLIQIWARKKYADSHQEDDFYYLDIENYEASGCPTCGSGSYYALEVYKYVDTTFKGKRDSYRRVHVDTIRGLDISSWLQEVTCPFEPLDKGEEDN